MKKIGFIGAVDKIDLILYAAKLLSETHKKVLVIDATILQKAKYIVPAMLPTKSYVTDFYGIDVAVGFEDLSDIEDYVNDQEIKYDLILIDIDEHEKIESFKLSNMDKLYFITSFDNYSIKKGLEIAQGIKQTMKKVLYEKEFLEEYDNYLNMLSATYSIKWEKDVIHFLHNNDDIDAIIENQKAEKIKFRNLSEEYREGLLEIVKDIEPGIKVGNIKKALKNI